MSEGASCLSSYWVGGSSCRPGRWEFLSQRANPALLEPIRQSLQVAGKVAEHGYAFFVKVRGNSQVDFFRSEVDPSIGLRYYGFVVSLLLFFAIVISLCGESGAKPALF